MKKQGPDCYSEVKKLGYRAVRQPQMARQRGHMTTTSEIYRARAGTVALSELSI